MQVDPTSHVPIYLQIVEGIRAAIAAGVHPPDTLLPSLRNFAFELKVNPNTVQKAYDELEREGLVYSRRGVGILVAQRGTESAQTQAEAKVRAGLRQAIEAARAANLSDERVQQLFVETLQAAGNPARRKS